MKLKFSKISVLTATMILSLTAPALASKSAARSEGVSANLVVKAKPAQVYEAIRAVREVDPEGVKVISSSPSEAVFEEVFEGLPVIGKSRCRYRETYVPGQRVDYHLIESDKFKAFQGSWTLTPAEGGNQTIVELSSFIDTGLKLPFARKITNCATLKDVKERLHDVKSLAESKSGQIAGKSTTR